MPSPWWPRIGAGAPSAPPITPKVDDAELAKVGVQILEWGAKAKTAGAEIAAAFGIVVGPKVDTGEMDAAAGKATMTAAAINAALGLTTGPTISTTSMDAAGAKANATGAEIATALSLTVRPNVDSGSIDAASAKTKALAAELSALSQSLAGAGRASGGIVGKGAPGAGGIVGSMAPAEPAKPAGRRKSGGPMRAALPYQLHENELITLGRNSYVTPEHRLQGADQSATAAAGSSPINFHNKFVISGANDPNAAARKIGNILQSQLNRSKQISLEDRAVI